MSAAVIDGKAVAAGLLLEVLQRAGVCAARGATPGLAVVLVDLLFRRPARVERAFTAAPAPADGPEPTLAEA